MSNDLILCELCYPNWAVASTSDQDGWLIKDQIQVVTNPVDIGPDQDPDTTPWKYGIAWGDGHSESVFEFPVAPIPDPLDGFSDDEIDNLPEEEFKDKCFNWVRDADLIEKPLYEWLNDPFTCYEFVKLFVDNGYNRKEDGYFHQYIFHQVGKMRMSFEDPSYI